MKRILDIFLLLFITSGLKIEVFAQTVQITEIQPHKIGNEEEWFEFSISDTSEINMSEWALESNSTKKLFLDHQEILEFSENAQKIENLHFKIIKSPAFFAWKKSPVGLPNEGGQITIKDEKQNILSSASYRKAKSGKTKEYEWSEVYNISNDREDMFPLIFRSNKDPKYSHSKLKQNYKEPTSENTLKIIISEISPYNSKNDFIELFIKESPEKSNLKYLSIKHNGTTLWKFESDFYVSKNDRILIYTNEDIYGITKTSSPYEIFSNKKPGLSSGSGTVELILWQGTSNESSVDFVCWQSKTLSKTEQKRVDKYILKKLWAGSCWEVENLIENESIGIQENITDQNSIQNLFRHFNGSPGNENINVNSNPKGLIEIQGSGKESGYTPFYLNLTGENSSDPNGQQDIKLFQWYFNDELISEKQNPEGFYIKEEGEHTIRLVITDHQNGSSISELKINTYQPGSSRSQSSQKVIIENLLKIDSKSKALPKPQEDMISNLLSQYSPKKPTKYPNYTEPEPKKSVPIKNTYKSYSRQYPSSERLVRVPDTVKPRLEKNIGILFSWRESPWPALKVESISDVEADQTFARFEAAYLGA